MRTIHIVIITGASKGIGNALYHQMKQKKQHVIGIARTNPTRDPHFIQLDLTNTLEIQRVVTSVIQQYYHEAQTFTLINNAGTVEPIGQIGSIHAQKLIDATTLNLTAPMLMCHTFIENLKSFKGDKRIINISSGAGRKVYDGWGVYCTTKAGLDHFSRVVASEQEKQLHPVHIVSIAPGIIDTNMQQEIRQHHEEAFPLVEQFKDYKRNKKLSTPHDTAHKLIRFIETRQWEKTGPIADLREFE